MSYTKTNKKFMDRSYIDDSVRNNLLQNKVVLDKKDVESIIDSILFDWNEIGDPEANFEEMIEWNVEQFVSHNSGNELKRISRNEARKMKLKRFYYKDYPAYSKEEPKFFSMSDSNKDGWQSIEYWM